MKTHCSFGPIWLIGSILLYSLFTTFCFFAVLVRFFCILPVPVDYSCYASSLMRKLKLCFLEFPHNPQEQKDEAENRMGSSEKKRKKRRITFGFVVELSCYAKPY